MLLVIEKYTNITFTEKQKEDPAKLFDLITSSNLWDLIVMNLNANDYGMLLKYIRESISSYYDYHNSIFGILDSINNDYNNLNFDATQIQKALENPEDMALLRDILSKLG
jgi:hypothetical protein